MIINDTLDNTIYNLNVFDINLYCEYYFLAFVAVFLTAVDLSLDFNNISTFD